MLVGAAVGLALGLIPGLINGLLVARLRVPPFIATLGTYGVANGMALYLSNGFPITFLPPRVQKIGNSFIAYLLPGKGFTFFHRPEGLKSKELRSLIGIVPVTVLVAAVVLLVFAFLLNRTRFGQHTYAIGGSKDAAIRAGINVPSHLLRIYILSSMFAAVAGVLYVFRSGIGNFTTMSASYELFAVAAVVIGGASLMGGKGGLGGHVDRHPDPDDPGKWAEHRRHPRLLPLHRHGGDPDRRRGDRPAHSGKEGRRCLRRPCRSTRKAPGPARWLGRNWAVLFLLLELAAFGLLGTNFFSPENLQNILVACLPGAAPRHGRDLRDHHRRDRSLGRVRHGLRHGGLRQVHGPAPGGGPAARGLDPAGVADLPGHRPDTRPGQWNAGGPPEGAALPGYLRAVRNRLRLFRDHLEEHPDRRGSLQLPGRSATSTSSTSCRAKRFPSS